MNLRTPPPQADDSDLGLTLDEYLPYRLSAAADAVSRLIARAYEDRFGLTISQWRVMCVLAEDAASTPAAAAARTGMDRASVGRAGRELLARGLVERAGAFGGEAALTLSRDGRTLFAEIAPLALAYEAALIAGLAPSEVAMMKRLLSRLQTAASALAGEAGR